MVRLPRQNSTGSKISTSAAVRPLIWNCVRSSIRRWSSCSASGPPTSGVAIRLAERDEAKNFTRILTEGFSGGAPITQSLLDTVEGFFHRTAGCSFYAVVDGELAGGAGLDIHDGLAVMAGASTLPQFRKRGAQTALLAGRLAWAAQNGCDLAVTITNPGTISQRNSERAGFRIVYTRTKLVREFVS